MGPARTILALAEVGYESIHLSMTQFSGSDILWNAGGVPTLLIQLVGRSLSGVFPKPSYMSLTMHPEPPPCPLQ
jgi:hypothetical protein